MIESQCAFCAFVAIAASLSLIELAEAAHGCVRLREFRKQKVLLAEPLSGELQ